MRPVESGGQLPPNLAVRQWVALFKRVKRRKQRPEVSFTEAGPPLCSGPLLRESQAAQGTTGGLGDTFSNPGPPQAAVPSQTTQVGDSSLGSGEKIHSHTAPRGLDLPP